MKVATKSSTSDQSAGARGASAHVPWVHTKDILERTQTPKETPLTAMVLLLEEQ
jgi:hypothetical protein